MRLAVLLAVAAAALCVVPNALAAGPVVYVDNQSTVVSQAQVDAEVAAFQTMVSRDLAPAWGIDAVLTDDPAYADTAAMVVRIEDDADCFGCLGFHDVINGRPTARVFARTSAGFNEAESLVASHELEEMLVDPWINRLSLWNQRAWLVEVSDPCESGQYAYFVNGVAVSDFVTPRWYDRTLRGPYDFTRAFRRPGQIGRHGYASYRDPSQPWGWGQVFGFGLPWADPK